MSMRVVNPFLWALMLVMPWSLLGQTGLQNLNLEYHGAGWAQIGKVESSYGGVDPASNANNADKNWLQNGGGVIIANAKMDQNWDAGLGFGVIAIHLTRGTADLKWYPFWVPFVSEARVTYSSTSPLILKDDKLQITVGAFPYKYSPDAKNLGLYLLHGYVYPGTLESGFGGIYGGVDPTEFGGFVRYEVGGFRNDLLLKSENRPNYDWSLADIASYQVRPGLEFGAGVNFYRLIPNNSDLTSPDTVCGGLKYGPCVIHDTLTNGSGGDSIVSITGSLSGIKLMSRFHIDPKLLFGFSHLGSLTLGGSDLVLYGEAAIIGLKDYPVYYDDMLRRIPVMFGFNFPAFGYLDYLSLEVEYYASKNSSDNVGAVFGGAWVPTNETDVDLVHYRKRDDWKWSVNAAKMFLGHMQLSAQVANDHLRLGGSHDLPWYGQEAMRTPEDWYWTCKLAYFF